MSNGKARDAEHKRLATIVESSTTPSAVRDQLRDHTLDSDRVVPRSLELYSD